MTELRALGADEITEGGRPDRSFLRRHRQPSRSIAPYVGRIAIVAALAIIAMGPPGFLDWLGVDPIDSCPEQIRELAAEWRHWVGHQRHRLRCEWRHATASHPRGRASLINAPVTAATDLGTT
jgi:hypothetical protein